jgi:ubiquinol-cytochrome c reductase cytochrome b subunit
VIVRLMDWLDDRTGLKAVRAVLFDEPLPPGTGWFFTLGSVLLALLGVQILTGAFLTLYYAPTPDHAYDSVRFISSTTSGRLVRGLHHFGASFIVVAAALHILRVIAFGSYKRPRELTWLSGVALLGLILAFALTGYLLPWDQRAYWATVVTINISRLAPGAGDMVAGVLQGGASIGALTLTRWYSAHVIFLPGLVVAIAAAHLVLMRRKGISGPVRAREGTPIAFYPRQAARDVTVVSIVLLVLVLMAWRGMPAMEGPADPTDATFIPRPEWYFLGLFQLLKYFPGKLEVLGAIILPTVLGGLLALLPWLDRGPDRDPRRRLVVMLGVAAGVLGIVALTTLGWRDRPVSAPAGEWSMRAIGGRQFAAAAKCARCHSESGMADALEDVSMSRGPEWLNGHVTDPEMIAPGLREPPTAVTEREGAALIAYVRQATRQQYPGYPEPIERAAWVWARYCVGCHVIDGDGGSDGPVLSHIGSKHDAPKLRSWIVDPEAVKPDTDMPAFGKRLSPQQLDAISQYLASRK